LLEQREGCKNKIELTMLAAMVQTTTFIQVRWILWDQVRDNPLRKQLHPQIVGYRRGYVYKSHWSLWLGFGMLTVREAG
jgi:hypothetical protein